MKRSAPLKARTPMKRGGTRLRQGRSTTSPTRAEQQRFRDLRDIGCICCYLNRQRGMPTAYFGIDVHHTLSGGRRRGHGKTLGCCPWHHRAVVPYEVMGQAVATAMFGPSLANGSKPFHAFYGSDDDLLELQDRLLAEVAP